MKDEDEDEDENDDLRERTKSSREWPSFGHMIQHAAVDHKMQPGALGTGAPYPPSLNSYQVHTFAT